MSDRPVTVVYHAGCWDGFCAAWILRELHPDAVFTPAYHGNTPPAGDGKEIIIADFSYKRPVMLDLIAQTRGHLTVLDHHKTAKEDLDGIQAECYRDTLDLLPRVVFDMGKSGGRLAWEYVWDRLYAGRFSSILGTDGHIDRDRPPWLVRYTEDRDLWRWALPDSREVNAALRSYPLDFAEWDRLDLLGPDPLVAEGRAILRRESQMVSEHVRHARPTSIGGYTVPACNATVLFSEIAERLAQGNPFGACYFDRADGFRQWSLRSREGGIDVSEVAKSLGGGGHPQAAGFQERLPVGQ